MAFHTDKLRLDVEVTDPGLRNLIQNPTGALGTWGWVTPVSTTTLATQPVSGTAPTRLRFTTTAAAAAYMTSEFTPMTALNYASVSWKAGPATSPVTRVRTRFEWYNSSKVLIASSVQSGTQANGAWTVGTAMTPVQAPTGTVYMKLRFDMLNSSDLTPAVGNYFDFTEVRVSQATTAAAVTSMTYKEPVMYQNVLGPTHSISINRAAFDVSTVNAEILDSTLDPSINQVLIPGKQVRVMANNAGTWEPIYTGRIDSASVKYETKGRSINDKGAVRVTIDTTDNFTYLSNQAESRGVDGVNNLAYLLEGKGAPWNINGSGAQMAGTAVPVSSNTDASVIDQVAIVRDSARGCAWIDRFNVLNVWNPGYMNNTVAQETFSDVSGVSYTDVDISFSTDDVINTVTIKWLRYNIGTGETEEISYGPYKNQTSIDKWGAFTREYTIGGSPTNETSTYMQSMANGYLTANANPTDRANSLTMRVKDAATLADAVSLDLYSLVNVTFADRVNTNLRITGIKHDITPDTWDVTYSFSDVGSTAAPIDTPSPPAVVVSNMPTTVQGSGKIASGTVTVTVTASTSGTATITFPTGLFTARPNVQVITRGNVAYNVNLPSTGDANTQVVRAGHFLNTSATTTVVVDWLAYGV